MVQTTCVLLTENDVVQSVKYDLEKRGWKVVSFCDTTTAGVDIHAVRGKQILYVEAKGVTSSKPLSGRYGKLQDASQIFIQVAAALLKCSELRSEHSAAAIAIAVPSHSAMERRVERIKPVLEAAKIAVIWANNEMMVSYWNAPWSRKRQANSAKP